MADISTGRYVSGVWYFAYGSNMSDAVMCRRGVQPMQARNAVAPSHILVFDVYGVPYCEPAMAAIDDRPADHEGPPVHGVVYLLTEADYARIFVSEGAGIGYREISIRVRALPRQAGVDTTGTPNVGPTIDARTLVARFPFRPHALPSARYMDVLTDAAAARELPQPYVDYLRGLPRYRRDLTPAQALGARVFSHVWTPLLGFVIGWAKKKAGQGPGGAAQEWVAQLVDHLFRTMWWYHDRIHNKAWRCNGGRP